MKAMNLRIGILYTAITLLLVGCAAPAAAPTPPALAQPAHPTSAPTVQSAVETQVVSPTPITAQPSTDASAVAPVTGGGITYVLVPDQSEARYRVREQLANRDLPNDAVGSTKSVTGQVVLKPVGTLDQANSKFGVDVSSLQTDQRMRDNYVRGNILQTSQYPQAVFVPTEITGLPAPLPQNGDVNFQVKGNLTIRDVTQPVTWDVIGKLQNGVATGTATTSFTFSQFNLNQPRVPVVLSVEDNIKLEVDLTLKPAS